MLRKIDKNERFLWAFATIEFSCVNQ